MRRKQGSDHQGDRLRSDRSSIMARCFIRERLRPMLTDQMRHGPAFAAPGREVPTR